MVEAVEGKVGELDVIIHNAGMQLDPHWAKGETGTRELWQRFFDVNVTGPQIIAERLLPLLLASSAPRLIFISSSLGSLDVTFDPAYPLNQPLPRGYPKAPHWTLSAYKASKAALNMMMREWAREPGNDGVKAFAVPPGPLDTGLGGYEGGPKRGRGDRAGSG